MTIGIFHGSPDDPDEFLFDTTPDARFTELAAKHHYDIIVTGHSHTPYVKFFGSTCFINPGSVGRMFDNDPRASCVIIGITPDKRIFVHHLRIAYDIEKVVAQLSHKGLPPIYGEMFRAGRKLN
jgi:predicted phosphodiesterase